MKKIITILTVCLFIQQALIAQKDYVFWFVAPEVTQSHGDEPTVLNLASYDQEAYAVVFQPANHTFIPEIFHLLPNSNVSIDLHLELVQFNTTLSNQLMAALSLFLANDTLLPDSLMLDTLLPVLSNIISLYTNNTYPANSLDLIENRPANIVLDKGICILSSGLISAYYEPGPANNSDIFTLKGRKALGTEFFIASQDTFSNGVGYSPEATNAFDIVATQDNTTITITPSHAIVGHDAGVPFNITLNLGQTYSATAVSNLGINHLQGSKISSDKPIAVTVKDDSVDHTKYAFDCWGWDLMGDQLLPVDALGTKYIVVKGNLYADEKAYILSTQDNTEVSLNGSLITTLAEGETYSLNIINDIYYIQTNEPVYVLHVSGNGCELGSALLPSLTEQGTDKLFYNKTYSYANNDGISLLLVTKNVYQNGFAINGNTSLINPADFISVPGTNNEWVAGKFTFTNPTQMNIGINEISNDLGYFHIGIIEDGDLAWGGGTRYGYFTDYEKDKLFNIGIKSMLPEKDNSIRIYPNPNNGLFTLEINNTENNFTVEVSDICGQVIMKENIRNSSNRFIKNIDLSDYTKGVYFVKITGANNTVSKKVAVF